MALVIEQRDWTLPWAENNNNASLIKEFLEGIGFTV
jgi:hypothetical protein